MSSSNSFQCKNLNFRYDEYNPLILQDFSITFIPNEITLITGVSGSGKSTLCYILSGLYPEHGGILESGEILINGINIHSIPINERAKLIGMMFQNANLQFCTDTPLNEIIFCLENIGIPKEEMDLIIERVLSHTEITHLKNYSLNTLSGGEKQRVALACSLAIGSKWLILDEPFANLDSESTEKFIKLLYDLKEEYEYSIIVIDHKISPWLDYMDKMILLGVNGCIISESVSKDNLSDYIKIFHDIGIEYPGDNYISRVKNNKPSKTMMSLKDISVKYDEYVLENLSLELERGKIYGITGKSGAGKSTLLKVISKNIEYEGTITAHTHNQSKIFKKSRNELKIGYIFQDPQDQFLTNNVLDEIMLSLSANGINDDNIAKDYLGKVNLWQYRNFSPYMLSQGQQRRLGVISVLAANYDILVCDEPTYAQDFMSVKEIMDLILSVNMNKEMTVIIISHDKKLIEQYTDYSFELVDGILKTIEVNYAI